MAPLSRRGMQRKTTAVSPPSPISSVEATGSGRRARPRLVRDRPRRDGPLRSPSRPPCGEERSPRSGRRNPPGRWHRGPAAVTDPGVSPVTTSSTGKGIRPAPASGPAGRRPRYTPARAVRAAGLPIGPILWSSGQPDFLASAPGYRPAGRAHPGSEWRPPLRRRCRGARPGPAEGRSCGVRTRPTRSSRCSV